jgi:glycyl-tRNA synthetase beta chain
VIEGKLPLNLGDTAVLVVDLLTEHGIKASPESGKPSAVEFILDRLRHYGKAVEGLRDDVMEAVLKPVHPLQVKLLDLHERMQALQAITSRPEFDPLMVGFKRAHRLVEKESWKEEDVNPALLQHQAETDLHKALDEARLQVPFAIEQGNHIKALDGLVRLKPAIDAFFVGVMVNTDDQGLRRNRLSLLCAVDRLFMRFADFSQIVVQGT